ncbi:MAG TPA: ABC transporter substrate-binding protein [Baekduia sp.]|uniref:ABC transporter substrate-binding protein n=1 Tax=Baekduia sp. TaxID=2600305 RepID=UPI002D79EE14|nr:ABC transporter substrate-binding protein [Baekduia sp.]HET6508334.1 ABC transporter substrate-binding protein [Baekduia sp.]
MIRRRARLVPLALTAVALAGTLSACGAKKDVTTTSSAATKRLDLVLDYLPNADHAPIYAAQAIGAFKAAGLDVRIQTPSDPATPLKLVESGRADLAISYEPELLLARDKGAHVAGVGALIQKPLTSIMSLNKHFTSVKDLKNATVGTAGIPYQTAYLRTIADSNGFSPSTIHEVNVGFNLVPSMLSKKVDATLGAFWNIEGVQLQRRHKDPTIIKMDEAGIPTYQELVFVANNEKLQEKGVGAVMRRFLQAVSRGASAVKADPAVGADALVKADPDLDRATVLAQIKATLPVFFPESSAFPWGYMNADEWAAYGQWMLKNKLVKTLPTATSITNEFLPGRGI